MSASSGFEREGAHFSLPLEVSLEGGSKPAGFGARWLTSANQILKSTAQMCGKQLPARPTPQSGEGRGLDHLCRWFRPEYWTREQSRSNLRHRFQLVTIKKLSLSHSCLKPLPWWI